LVNKNGGIAMGAGLPQELKFLVGS